MIKSHHEPILLEKVREVNVDHNIVDEVTWKMIKEHSKLIVSIEEKKAPREVLEKEIIQYLDETFSYHIDRNTIIKKVMNYMFGYGVIQSLIEDEDISDIDICRFDFIMIKKNGHKQVIPLKFENEEVFTRFAKLVVIRLGGVINDNDAHARVADEKYRLRINVSITPRNLTGTTMIIRKHRLKAYSLNELIELDMLNEMMSECLSRIMKVNSRILIVGKGGSGKTTLLRTLLREVPYTERFLVCETEAEIFPESQNFIVQKVQKKSDSTVVSLRTLIRDGLTMSLDGYCIGEIIGDELNEFIKAGYTDHRIIGTFHAKGVEEAFIRMKKIIENTELNYLYNAFDIIIYIKKFKIYSIVQLHERRFVPLFTFIPIREDDTKVIGNFIQESDLVGSLKKEMSLKSL